MLLLLLDCKNSQGKGRGYADFKATMRYNDTKIFFLMTRGAMIPGVN
jgi:hypothetical protein